MARVTFEKRLRYSHASVYKIARVTLRRGWITGLTTKQSRPVGKGEVRSQPNHKCAEYAWVCSVFAELGPGTCSHHYPKDCSAQVYHARGNHHLRIVRTNSFASTFLPHPMNMHVQMFVQLVCYSTDTSWPLYIPSASSFRSHKAPAAPEPSEVPAPNWLLLGKRSEGRWL